MSYDLHVHRAADWMESSEQPIGRTEWEMWVEETPDFRFDETISVSYSDDERGDWTETGAVWTAHPDGRQWASFYDDGAVMTGNPDEHVVRRMAQVAASLGARLQGDDGEFYDADGDPLPDD